MDENPFLTTVLEPFRLVLRYSKCYYCNSPEYDDTCIEVHFGIRHCPTHAAWARRDCNAYLHAKKQVPLWDAWNHPVLKELFTLLTTNTVHVLRSNGSLQSGWILRPSEEYSFAPDFLVYLEGDWLLPMKHQTEGIQKHVGLLDLLQNEPTGILTKELVDRVFAVLEEGLYKQDFLKQQECLLLSSDSTKPEECTTIRTGFWKGRECRVAINPNRS